MNVERPSYWLVYLSCRSGPPGEVTATAPAVLDRRHLSRAVRVVLAEADTYHQEHPHQRVVFTGELTQWLRIDNSLSWADLEVDLDTAIAELDRCAPALVVDDLPGARRAARGQGAAGVHQSHSAEIGDLIAVALERDWPTYIRTLLAVQER